MNRKLLIACILMAWVFTSPVLADEARIRSVVGDKLGVRVEAVQPAPLPGLFEVHVRSSEGARVVYTDAAANLVFIGDLYDTRTDRNLTEERLRKLSAIDFKSLPLDQAVRIRRGNGKRVLAMFSDPYCPACRQFEKVLKSLDDITIYVFMYPVIRPENADHSRSVWCSPDRARAWLDLAAGDAPKIPSAAPRCANPVEKVLALGRSLGVNSTPTLYFANGERMNGGLPADRLVRMFDEVAAQSKTK